jgi:hypothetical protein
MTPQLENKRKSEKTKQKPKPNFPLATFRFDWGYGLVFRHSRSDFWVGSDLSVER